VAGLQLGAEAFVHATATGPADWSSATGKVVVRVDRRVAIGPGEQVHLLPQPGEVGLGARGECRTRGQMLVEPGIRSAGEQHAAAAKRLMELIEFDLVVLDVRTEPDLKTSQAKIKGAVRTDFILSAEIVVISRTAMGDCTGRKSFPL